MKPGAHVRIATKNDLEFTGTVLPGESLVLKLDDGYNVGIDKRNIKDIQELEKKTGKKTVVAPIKKDPKLKKIVLLHTGGTIASKVDYETGGTKHLFEPDEILALYPELQEIAHVQAKAVTSMWSEDFRIPHFNKIAQLIEQALADKADGVIVTTGTDYMHYAAAATHYALLGVPIPVVFTGSQRSSDRGSADSFTNLSGAARFIVETKMKGVFIAMHEHSDDTAIQVISAVNSRKMHASRRDAFRSINTPIVARITAQEVQVLCEKSTQRSFSPMQFKEDLKIGVCMLHPQFFAQELEVYKKFDALILLGCGLGHAPINMTDDDTHEHHEVFMQIQALTKKIPVVMATQTIHGRISLQVYSTGRRLQDIGVLGHDLAFTYETLFCKLAYILSQGLDPAKALYEDFDDAINRIEEAAYE